nr:class I SAM-dependent methyltransferase [Candidatus Sigynarchaeota archaeon]
MSEEQDEVKRVTRSKEEAKTTYDKMSKSYDAISGSSENKFKWIGLEFLDAKEGETLLELGFGTGKVLERLARMAGENGKVHGIDLSPGMLAITEKRLRKTGLLGRVELRLGDIAHLPYMNDQFDAIFTSFTFDLVDTPEIPVVLAECRKVLKTGGRICIVSLSRGNGRKVAVRVYEWFHEKFPKAIDCRPINAREALIAAGFSITREKRDSMWGLPVDIVLAKK